MLKLNHNDFLFVVSNISRILALTKKNLQIYLLKNTLFIPLKIPHTSFPTGMADGLFQFIPSLRIKFTVLTKILPISEVNYNWTRAELELK